MKILRACRRAFTLVEMMIVVAIIALLAAISIPSCIRKDHPINDIKTTSTVFVPVPVGGSSTVQSSTVRVDNTPAAATQKNDGWGWFGSSSSSGDSGSWGSTSSHSSDSGGWSSPSYHSDSGGWGGGSSYSSDSGGWGGSSSSSSSSSSSASDSGGW